MMRNMSILASLLLFSCAAVAQWLGGGWGYLGLVFAAAGGVTLVFSGTLGVYYADQQGVDQGASWLWPVRDYRSLRAMAYRLMQRASSTAIASAEVSHHADQMGQRLDKQEQMARDSSTSMSAINAAIMQVSSSATHVATLAESARHASHENRSELEEIITEMNDISSRSSEALEMLTSLNEKIERVRSVTSMIEDIAEQTHLLSLNASIEAARAGEHGRGFAVVAGEVRNLALKTSTATQNVDELVKDMHQSGQSVVDSMGHLMTRIRERSQGIGQVGSRLGSMTDEVDQVHHEITQVAEAMENTRQHSQTVTDSLHQLESDVDEGSRNMHALAEQARALMDAAESVDGELAQQRLAGRHQAVFHAAREAADQIGQRFEQALKKGELTQAALFNPHYEPIEGTQPPMYHTGFDDVTDRLLPAIQEPMLNTLSLGYAIACDRQGYVPTHNQAVSQTPTGDYAHDLAFCRSKRIFDDPTGRRCGKHEQPLLLQTYKRDTGEIMHDLSVPIYVNGKHWGGFRVGYKPESGNAQHEKSQNVVQALPSTAGVRSRLVPG